MATSTVDRNNGKPNKNKGLFGVILCGTYVETNYNTITDALLSLYNTKSKGFVLTGDRTVAWVDNSTKPTLVHLYDTGYFENIHIPFDHSIVQETKIGKSRGNNPD